MRDLTYANAHNFGNLIFQMSLCIGVVLVTTSKHRFRWIAWNFSSESSIELPLKKVIWNSKENSVELPLEKSSIELSK